jgi:hypothetical protein
MPRSVSKPAYFRHKPSGQARVRIDGKDHYLGLIGSEDSWTRYDALVEEWARRRPVNRATLTIDELCLRFLAYAKKYYVKAPPVDQPADIANGEEPRPVTSEVACIRAALRPLIRKSGTELAAGFGPLKLKAVRESMIASGATRPTINKYVQKIKGLFRWAVENVTACSSNPRRQQIQAITKRFVAFERPYSNSSSSGPYPFRRSRDAVFTNAAKSSGTQFRSTVRPPQSRCWRSTVRETSPTVTTVQACLFSPRTKPCWSRPSGRRTNLAFLTSGNPRPLNHWKTWRRSLADVGRDCARQASMWQPRTRHAAVAAIHRCTDRRDLTSMLCPSRVSPSRLK